MKNGEKWSTELALELESLFYKESVAEGHIEIVNGLVIMFAKTADAFVSQVAGRFYELNCQLNDAVRQYTFSSAETHFGVSFSLTMQGKLSSCRDLSESELKQLCNRQDAVQVANGVDCIGNLSGEQIHDAMFGSGLL